MLPLRAPTVRMLLRWGSTRLAHKGIATAYLDASLLLAHCRHQPMEALYAQLPDSVPLPVYNRYRRLIRRRCRNWPIAYLCGTKEFYTRQFRVTHNVLIPRPDTETIIDLALTLSDNDPAIQKVHDCCTGSGVIAITLAIERPSLHISASDYSRRALRIARYNARHLCERVIPMYRSNLLKAITGKFDLIIANPPYLTYPQIETLHMSSRWIPRWWNGREPSLALYGGSKGTKIIFKLAAEALEKISEKGYLLIEIGDDQHEGIQHPLRNIGWNIIQYGHDLAGKCRALLLQRCTAIN